MLAYFFMENDVYFGVSSTFLDYVMLMGCPPDIKMRFFCIPMLYIKCEQEFVVCT